MLIRWVGQRAAVSSRQFSRDLEREAQRASVRGPARFPTVALTVAVMAEGAVGSGWQPSSPHNPPGPLAWGPLGELGVPGQALGCVLCSSRAPGPAALGTSPPSLPPRSNGGGGLQRSESVEASATGVCGHCHSGTSFSQLQSLPSGFKTRSSIDQLSIPSKWPEVRVKFQGPCTWLLQVHLCGWGSFQPRAVGRQDPGTDLKSICWNGYSC